jgi:hypothetical protein
METYAEPKELSREEFAELLEERVQASLNMSTSEFIAGLEDGRLDPESPRVASLAIRVGARAR